MPPRHAYWTILVDNQPTAFRAHEADELMPTLNRLKEKHASAVMKWFERGKLWDSKDAARAEGLGRGERRWQGPRPDRPVDSPRRDRDWRPGGEHRDPRQKYKDAKKAKWTRFKKKIRDRADRARESAPPDADPRKFSPPHGDPLRSKTRRDWQPPRDRNDWKNRERVWGDRPDRFGNKRQPARWSEDRRDDEREKRRHKPWGERPKSGGPKKRFGAKKEFGAKKPGRFKPSHSPESKSQGDRPRFQGSRRQGGNRNARGPRGPRKPRDDE